MLLARTQREKKELLRFYLFYIMSDLHELCVQVGDESYESYSAEKDGILSSLARRAKVSSMQQPIS